MPTISEAFRIAIQHHQAGRLPAAEQIIGQILVVEPNHADALHLLGVIAHQLGKHASAIDYMERSIGLTGNVPAFHNNLGEAHYALDRLPEAVACYRRALALKPDYFFAIINLGNVLLEQGNLEEALACYRRALELKPDDAEVHYSLAHVLLLEGDFEEGWAEYEWRWQTRILKSALRPYSQPVWQGDPLPQGTILLHAEQGLGDTIQFIRFAALVKERVGRVLCSCPPELMRLLHSCAGIDRIIPFGEPLPAHDVQVPLMSLPKILKTTLATIPARIPYLATDAALTAMQAHALESTDFKIGIVWLGNRRFWDVRFKRPDQLRSIPLVQFEPLAHIPGVRLISLQKGFGSEQIQDMAGRFPIAELGSTCHDFCDTAAVMKSLDLVISVDSSPVHLAGALGVPVWLPLPWACCWRWLLDREDSPWYPDLRLFRQSRPGDWGEVVERMGAALREKVASRMRP